MAEQVLNVGATASTPVQGSTGLASQQPGIATTVSGQAEATGGIGPGQLFETDIDKELSLFESDDNPLVSVVLNGATCKQVSVDSPVVQHYAIDEERTSFETQAQVAASASDSQAVLNAGDAKEMCPVGTTLRCRGVNGYTQNGQTETPGVDLMLLVVNKDTTGNPVVTAVNGKRTNATDATCQVPYIPNGTVVDILANAAYETQRWGTPSTVQPVPTEVYLQKSILVDVKSDYWESQKKRLPYAEGVIAEHNIRKFKREVARTLWMGAKGKFLVSNEKVGTQTIYMTEGLRWQFANEIVRPASKWTYEELIAIAKMLKTGTDSVDGATVYCGKDALEAIQCIDFSNHPEVIISKSLDGTFGWKLHTITTAFGDLRFKHDPSLDALGLTHSMAIIGDKRLVRYMRAPEHTESERIEGHEATMESTILWYGIALKGTCHIWVNGEGKNVNANAIPYQLVKAADLTTGSYTPSGGSLTSVTNSFVPSGTSTIIYYFTVDATYITSSTTATTIKAGEMWKWDGTSLTKYTENTIS